MNKSKHFGSFIYSIFSETILDKVFPHPSSRSKSFHSYSFLNKILFKVLLTFSLLRLFFLNTAEYNWRRALIFFGRVIKSSLSKNVNVAQYQMLTKEQK